MTKTEKALRAFQRAVKRLDSKQGVVARRNARRAVGAAYRVLKQRIDEEYPSLVKHKAAAASTVSTRRARLLAKGFKKVDPRMSSALVLAMAEAGIRPTVLRWNEGTGYYTPGTTPPTIKRTETWVPGWCTEIGADAAKLRKAKKSQRERAAIRAESALLALGNGPL